MPASLRDRFRLCLFVCLCIILCMHSKTGQRKQYAIAKFERTQDRAEALPSARLLNFVLCPIAIINMFSVCKYGHFEMR